MVQIFSNIVYKLIEWSKSKYCFTVLLFINTVILFTNSNGPYVRRFKLMSASKQMIHPLIYLYMAFVHMSNKQNNREWYL